MSTFTIRQAAIADVPAIIPLWTEMMTFHAERDPRFRPHPDGERAMSTTLNEWIQSAEIVAFVADAGGRLVGYIIGHDRENAPVLLPPRYGFISDIGVAADWRRRGVGRALFTTVIDWFKQRGLPEFRLSVAVRNPVSQAFWRQMGCEDYLDQMWGQVP